LFSVIGKPPIIISLSSLERKLTGFMKNM